MSEHARLAPSAASRWVRCPGSVRAIAALDRAPRPNIPSMRGTYMHLVLGECLHDVKRIITPHDWIGKSLVVEPGEKPITFDEDMAEWTMESLQWIFDYLDKTKNVHLFSEEKVYSGHALDPGLAEDIWGTADVLILSPGKLVVGDLKGGYVYVDVEDNYQLLIYAIGAISKLAFHTLVKKYGIKEVSLVIWQPRSGGTKKIEMTIDEVLDYKPFFKRAAEATKREDAPLKASEEACKYCPLIGTCSEAHKLSVQVAKTLAWPDAVSAITEEQFRLLLDRGPFIKKLLEAVERHAINQILEGGAVRGYKLVSANTHRRWKDDEAAAKWLTRYLKEGAYSQKLLTPAAAEKALKRAKVELNEDLVERPVGEPRLVPDSDARKAIDVVNVSVVKTKKTEE